MRQNKLWQKGLGLLAMTLTAAGLASCGSEELAGGGLLPEGKYPLELTATVGELQTRAAGKDAFSDGDTISVRIGTSGAGSKYVINGSMQAQPANDSEQLYWQSKDQQTVEAWYPYDAQTDIDISNQADRYTQFDYLKATEANQSYTSSVSLSFKHQMAKVKCGLIKGDGVTDKEIATAKVSVYGYTKALYSEGVLTGSTDGWITMTTANHEALLVPRDMGGQPFIRVAVGSNTFIYTTPAGTANLKAGNVYTYSITVKANGIEVTKVTSSDWISGGSENVYGHSAKADKYIDTSKDVDYNRWAVDITEPDKTYYIYQTNTTVQQRYIKVDIGDGNSCTIYLDNVNFKAPGSNDWGRLNNCLRLVSGNVKIVLIGNNTLTGNGNSNYGNACILSENTKSTLTITNKDNDRNSGSLTAIGGNRGAYGNASPAIALAGNLLIQNTTITAKAGEYNLDGHSAAGIGAAGGSTGATCGDITIENSTVTALGVNNGAAIGTGRSITRGGGTINKSTCGSITIKGSELTLTATEALIGNGENRVTNASGQELYNCNTCGAIIINNSIITSTTDNIRIGANSAQNCVTGTVTITNTKLIKSDGTETKIDSQTTEAVNQP